MITPRLFQELRRQLPGIFRRNIGISAPVIQKASDPIQQLFLDKLREYTQKSKASGGKLIDATPEIQKELNSELEKAAKQYGGGEGVDMTKFPEFKFQDPPLDPIDEPAQK